MLAGTVRARRRQRRLSCVGGRGSGRRAAGGSGSRAARGALGAIRAEQIRIAPAASRAAGLRDVVRGTVEDVIFEGERIVYEVRVAGLARRLCASSTTTAGPAHRVRDGRRRFTSAGMPATSSFVHADEPEPAATETTEENVR